MTSPIALRREPRAGDVAALRELVTATGFFADHEIEIAVELVEEALEKGAAAGYDFFFADGPDGLLGYVCFGEIPCTRGSYDLYWIAVHPSAQGGGLGRRLLAAAEEEAARRAGRAVYIETSSKELYRPTQAFYERTGYELVARFRDFYEQDDDKLVYRKDLTPGQKAK